MAKSFTAKHFEWGDDHRGDRQTETEPPACASAERRLPEQAANEITVRSDVGLPLDGVGKTWELE